MNGLFIVTMILGIVGIGWGLSLILDAIDEEEEERIAQAIERERERG